MSNENTGEPAFPVQDASTWQAHGLSIRDYFAAKVMQAEMMNGVHESDFPEYAARAYKMADTMLKAREA